MAWSTVPKEITTGEDITQPVVVDVYGKGVEIPHRPGPPIIYLTLVSAMFMHGGVMHIVGNLLYLWIFGDNVEHRFGSWLFLIFYLISGLIASIAQIMLDPDGVIPNLGASGAIFGVLGAYLVLFPHNKVNVVVFYFILSLPAYIVIGAWATIQIFQGFGSFFVTEQTGGVAYMAHVGGLFAGVGMGLVARMIIQEEPDSALYRQYENDPTSRRWW